MNNSLSNNSNNDKKYTSIYTPYRQLLLVSPSSSSAAASSSSAASSPISLSPSIATSFPSSSSKVYLPFYKQITFPPPPDEIPFLPTILPESCGFKIVQGAIIGSILGVGLGIFMGAMGDVSPIVIINGKEVPMAPLREQMRGAYKSTIAKSVGWAKNFGILTALFGGVECVIEKHRAKHDVWNPVLSGCAVGGTLSARAGPAAACIGCVGFGGFSLVVDKIMGH